MFEEIDWGLPSVRDATFVPRAWSIYVGAINSLVQEGPLAFATACVYALHKGITFGDCSHDQLPFATGPYRLAEFSPLGRAVPEAR